MSKNKINVFAKISNVMAKSLCFSKWLLETPTDSSKAHSLQILYCDIFTKYSLLVSYRETV